MTPEYHVEIAAEMLKSIGSKDQILKRIGHETDIALATAASAHLKMAELKLTCPELFLKMESA